MHAFLLFVALSPVTAGGIEDAVRDVESAVESQTRALQGSLDDIAHYQYLQAVRAGLVAPPKPRLPAHACSKSGQGPLPPCQRTVSATAGQSVRARMMQVGQMRRAKMMWRQAYIARHNITPQEFDDACLAQWQAQQAQAAAE